MQYARDDDDGCDPHRRLHALGGNHFRSEEEGGDSILVCKRAMTTNNCCAECGKEECVSLKACKSCMQVKYCNAECQHKHWVTHKIPCKIRAAELRDEALFKDPPPKEDCPICFLPMPQKLISCMSLPPATRSSVPIYDFATANDEFANVGMEKYYSCCGKTICGGCVHSCCKSGNNGKCLFCNSDRDSKTAEENVEDIMKRVEANDSASIYLLADYYHHGSNGLQQDQERAIELYTKAAELWYSEAHLCLGNIYRVGGAPKKAKFHYEAAAMAGNEASRCNLGIFEAQSGNIERAVKHWMIAASAGECHTMHQLRTSFENGAVSRESINSTLAAYNNSCAEVRSEARDACIQIMAEALQAQR